MQAGLLTRSMLRCCCTCSPGYHHPSWILLVNAFDCSLALRSQLMCLLNVSDSLWRFLLNSLPQLGPRFLQTRHLPVSAVCHAPLKPQPCTLELCSSWPGNMYGQQACIPTSTESPLHHISFHSKLAPNELRSIKRRPGIPDSLIGRAHVRLSAVHH
jgi:hypothetical protein